jgi:hypothetical protein
MTEPFFRRPRIADEWRLRVDLLKQHIDRLSIDELLRGVPLDETSHDGVGSHGHRYDPNQPVCRPAIQMAGNGQTRAVTTPGEHFPMPITRPRRLSATSAAMLPLVRDMHLGGLIVAPFSSTVGPSSRLSDRRHDSRRQKRKRDATSLVFGNMIRIGDLLQATTILSMA